MATIYQFECNACGYLAYSPGQPARTFTDSITPACCLDCGILFSLMKKSESNCPECGSSIIELWDYKNKPCPKCRLGTMNINPGGMIINLD